MLLRRVAPAFVVASAFVSVPLAGDPRQPIRALIVALALVLMAALAISSDMRADRRSRLAGIAAGILFCVMVLSAGVNGLSSGVFGVHGRFTGLVFWLLLLTATVAGWLSRGAHARWLARAAGLAAAVQALVIGYQVLAGSIPNGTNGNQVMTGGWLAICSAMAIAAALLEKSRVRWLLALAGVSGVVAAGMVGSRGAWVGLAVGALPLLAVSGVRPRRALLGALALAVAVSLGALVAGGESLAKLDPSRLFSASGSARMAIWQGSVDLIVDNPALGVGPGRFLYEFPRYEPLEHALIEGPDVRADQAHDHLLQVAAEGGVMASAALLALVALVGSAAVGAIRRKDASAVLLAAGFAAYVGQGLFGIQSVEIDALGWMLGGMLLARGIATDASVLSSRSRAITTWVTSVVGVLLVVVCGWYLAGDLAYGRGLDAFYASDMPDAAHAHEAAIARNPLVDIYRVAYADVAAWSRGETLARAEDLLADGLRLEPDSYDLAVARARNAVALGSGVDIVADRYEAAAALYPWGLTVRHEAIGALLAAGRTEEARAMASDVLLLAPEDPVALSIVGAAE